MYLLIKDKSKYVSVAAIRYKKTQPQIEAYTKKKKKKYKL